MKILVKGVNWIGDAVLMTPALAALRKNFPDAYISLLTIPYVEPIFTHNPWIDEIIIFDKMERHQTLSGKNKLTRQLKKQKFDLGIVMQPKSYEAAFLLCLAKIPERLGYSYGIRNLLFTRVIPPPPPRTHLVEVYRNIISPLGIKEKWGQLSFPKKKRADPIFLLVATDDKADGTVKEFFQAHTLSKGNLVIGINPGAAYGPAKRWSAECYAQVADELIRHHHARILILGSKSEISLLEKVAGLMKEKAIIITPPLSQLISFLKYCRLLITNDTGPMHIATAVGTPVVAIFGPTDPCCSRPWQGNNIVLYKELPCSLCFKHNCKKHTCMKEITVKEVLSACEKLLSL